MAECIAVLYFLASAFTVKWSFPQGIDYGGGRICICDTDRDNNYELIFSTYGGAYTIYFYELHLPGAWEVDSAFDLNQPLLWDQGDFDDDGLHDLVMQCGGLSPYWVGVSIFESPDSFSYPVQEVWRDTVGFALVQPITAYDVDRDGYPDILDNNGDGQPHYFWIFEAIGNNQYDTVFTTNPDTLLSDGPSSTHAFGDFDADNRIEFVMGGMSGRYWIYESPGNNIYDKLVQGVLPTANIKDCFSVPDADGDGKLEFVVKGFTVTDSRIHAYIFEATGDNTYEVVKSFDLSGGYNLYGGGYSEAGDVDGDSIPEIVLEACQSIHIIKSAGNDSFYVWETLPGNLTGSSVRVTNDLDHNGLNEIVISGNNQTRIYEYIPGSVNETARCSEPRVERLTVFPNPFGGKTTISWQMNDIVRRKANDRFDLKIYNSTGQLVRFFSMPANNTQLSAITWLGDDSAGRQLPPGIYFVQLKSGGNEKVEKTVLLR